MILRKPYAFFIKYFKVIHFIMATLMISLVFQTNKFLIFLNDQINSSTLVLGQNASAGVFKSYSYLIILLIIIMDIMIWVLMDFKKKKRVFYSLNFIALLLLTVFYFYMNSTLSSMNVQIIDKRLLMVLRDLSIIAFSIQTVFLFITIIRAFGINIKQFDFKSDLQDLELLDSDNEEFEVNLEFDYEKLKRSFRATMRNFSYYVKENFRMILVIGLVLVSLVVTFIYKNTRGYITKYNQGELFLISDYYINIKDSYVTGKDYRLNDIKEGFSLVILSVDIKSNVKNSIFEFGRFALKIGDNKYYHNIKYVDYVKDIGTGYIKQKLTSTPQEFLLIYEIPKNLVSKKMEFVYVNKISAGIFGQDKITVVSLKPEKLDTSLETLNINLNDDISFENINNKNLKISFKTIEMADVFKIRYNYSIKGTNEKFEFYEPLQTEFYGSYDKALLKIQTSISDILKNTMTPLGFIKLYGSLEYESGGIIKNISIKTQVVPKRVQSSSYYFEIPYEALEADTVKLKFKTRKKNYIYKIK